jgi:hypothetical protein
MLEFEVACVLLFLAGVGLVWVPASLVLGGVLGVVAVEREMSRQAAADGPGKGRER